MSQLIALGDDSLLDLILTISIVELNLQETKMQTSIPTTVTNMVNLEILDLTHSGITGLLPSEIGALTKLTQLSLGENVFIGDIPSEFTMLSLLGTSRSFEIYTIVKQETYQLAMQNHLTCQ